MSGVTGDSDQTLSGGDSDGSPPLTVIKVESLAALSAVTPKQESEYFEPDNMPVLENPARRVFDEDDEDGDNENVSLSKRRRITLEKKQGHHTGLPQLAPSAPSVKGKSRDGQSTKGRKRLRPLLPWTTSTASHAVRTVTTAINTVATLAMVATAGAYTGRLPITVSSPSHSGDKFYGSPLMVHFVYRQLQPGHWR